MSRVGKQPIDIPSGIEVKIDGQTVTITGSKGTLVRTISDRISMAVEGDQILVTRVGEDRESRAEHGLFRSLIANMVIGVSEGYGKELEIRGVGYRASMKGRNIELLVGFSHPVLMETPEGITVEVPEPTRINVSGIDKELVGQIAANIRSARPPEPYKGKGIRYVGEHVRRKAGKAGVAQ